MELSTVSPGRRRRARRAFTLLELLIVLALLVALGTVTLATLIPLIDERTYDTAVEVTRSQLLLARAHAQSTGRAVEVRYDATPPRIEARWFVPDADDVEPGVDEESTLIPEDWAYRLLPEGIDVSRTLPEAVAEAEMLSTDLAPPAELEALSAADEPALLDDADGDIRLAVYLADGSALLGEPFWIGSAEGRWGRVEVNPWTGLAQFSTLDAVLAAASGEPEELEEEEREEDFEEDEPEREEAERDDPVETRNDAQPGAEDGAVSEGDADDTTGAGEPPEDDS
jgi:prepilin-type N-terminal cleavage/methylation domain-containing protein